MGSLVWRQFKNILAFKPYLSFGNCIGRMPHQGIGQGRFAGAVRPHQSVYFTLLHAEIDAFKDLAIFDADMQIANFQF